MGVEHEGGLSLMKLSFDVSFSLSNNVGIASGFPFLDYPPPPKVFPKVTQSSPPPPPPTTQPRRNTSPTGLSYAKVASPNRKYPSCCHSLPLNIPDRFHSKRPTTGHYTITGFQDGRSPLQPQPCSPNPIKIHRPQLEC